MKQDLAKKILADALEVAISDIPDDASLEEFEFWDSLGHVRLISAIESSIHRQLETLEILGLVDLKSLAQLINSESSG